MNKQSISKIIRTVSVGILIFWTILTPLVWTVRDGLGPNAVDSSGLLAIEKTFLAFYWGPILILLIVVNLIFRKIIKRPSADRDA
ncbi:hypothetical protein ACFLTH_10670 [Bacteroidota bacterium]